MTLNARHSRIGLAAITGFAALGVLYSFPPTQFAIYPRCPFFAMTHLLCPGCGGTRAVYELLHMNVSGALHYNALVTVLAPMVVGWLSWGCYRMYRDQRFPPVPRPRAVAVALGVIAILFAVVRDAGIAFVI